MADFIHGVAVIKMRKENAMAKNLLLEYSEELASKCELLCKSISGNSNIIFRRRTQMNEVALRANDVLRNDVGLRPTM